MKSFPVRTLYFLPNSSLHAFASFFVSDLPPHQHVLSATETTVQYVFFAVKEATSAQHSA